MVSYAQKGIGEAGAQWVGAIVLSIFPSGFQWSSHSQVHMKEGGVVCKQKPVYNCQLHHVLVEMYF